MLKAVIVDDLFNHTLHIEGEDNSTVVKTKGLRMTFDFHPRRLDENREKIISLLHELPEKFRRSLGDGWSFLHSENDRHGNEWGNIREMEKLMLLGLAIGKVEYLLPKKEWVKFPGEIPYFVFLD